MFMTLVSIILSYFIGSIPTAYIFGKIYKGIDIRQHGSGNVGATNVFRVVGKAPGVIVLLLDIVKGVIPVVIISSTFGVEEPLSIICISVAVVCGHNWTIFLKFKGGKGIATTLGVLIGLAVKMPEITPILLITLISWIICFLSTRIVSISSILASIVLPVSMVFFNSFNYSIPFEIVCLGIVFCVFIVIRHKSNIKRILAGQEPRIPLSFKKK